jgi:CRP-like cAMP-binding protein
MAKPTPQGENRLLNQLTSAELRELGPHLRTYPLVQGAVLHPVEQPISYVYFPTSGMVSLLAVMKDGQQIETGIVGREGVVGASIANHGLYAFGQATVQITGSALQMESKAFLQMFDRSERFRLLINTFQSVILIQAQQSAACHAVHDVEARLCRWLLQSQDVLASDRVQLTQDFLSHMLGVRRNAVSAAATILQKRGLIEYSRGDIKILEREGLEACACECYELILFANPEPAAFREGGAEAPGERSRPMPVSLVFAAVVDEVMSRSSLLFTSQH